MCFPLSLGRRRSPGLMMVASKLTGMFREVFGVEMNCSVGHIPLLLPLGLAVQGHHASSGPSTVKTRPRSPSGGRQRHSHQRKRALVIFDVRSATALVSCLG